MRGGLATRLWATGALVWAAGGCGGRTIGVSNSEPDNAPQCNGCMFTHSDNPVLTGDVELNATSNGFEHAIRLDDSSWRFERFQLSLSATGGDASQGSVNESGDPYAGPVPWPSMHGNWNPDVHSPITLPWEAHGVRVALLEPLLRNRISRVALSRQTRSGARW